MKYKKDGGRTEMEEEIEGGKEEGKQRIKIHEMQK